MRTIITHCMILTAGVANAQRHQSSGVGARSCAQFAEDYRQSPGVTEQVYFSWAQGFMSGMNFALSSDDKLTYRDLNSSPAETQKAFIRKYCNDLPLGYFADAVLNLFNSLPPATTK